ncbi:MAG: hypothetical protein NT159_05785 [Proteobacteria bacterium]|nr:hypothetical protein [Pseudomonadota bacterium]
MKLITRGYRYWDDQEKLLDEMALVQTFFRSITVQDVKNAIAEFEHSTDPEERWNAAKAIIAYFRWRWRNGDAGVAGLDALVLSFAKGAFVRIAGARLTSGDKDDGELLPAWCNPDMAFGCKRPNHRVAEDNDIRDITLAMCVEYRRRTGVEIAEAKKGAAKMFGVSLAVVAKAITRGNKIGYGTRFSQLSEVDLKAEVDDYFESKKEITTR